jgi:hypothetical protein
MQIPQFGHLQFFFSVRISTFCCKQVKKESSECEYATNTSNHQAILLSLTRTERTHFSVHVMDAHFCFNPSLPIQFIICGSGGRDLFERRFLSEGTFESRRSTKRAVAWTTTPTHHPERIISP